jgi:undecaprenyl diphosphate synthase
MAIIMDGNGRWAKKKLKPRSYGHVKGTRVAKDVIHECSKIGIKYLTLYAFSQENWKRPSLEVHFLMKLLKKYLSKETNNLVKENIHFQVLGEVHRLPLDVQEQLKDSMLRTSHCTGLRLVFALSYGSRQEIALASRAIAQKVKDGELQVEEINESVFEAHLGTFGLPDPDFVLRTSGEVRVSNFLLWQSAYSEFYFSPLLWPEFTLKDLHQALAIYSKRDRRFGTISEKKEEGSVKSAQDFAEPMPGADSFNVID